MIPFFVAAAAGVATFFGINKFARPSLASFAATQNANTDAINAANAALAAKGIVALGAGPRAVTVDNLVQGPGNIVFVRTSPAGFLGKIDDNSFIQLAAEDIITVDVKAASIQLAEIPEGNMLFKVSGAPSLGTHTVPAVSIDPRLPATSTVVSVPQLALTDAFAGGADPRGHVIGMGQ